MINAEIIPESETLVFVRFSNPDEDFGSKPFFAVPSVQEAKKRMCARNKMYIIDKLKTWLNQRSNALPSMKYNFNQLFSWIKSAEENDFFYLCDFIELRRSSFEKVAPNETSRQYNFYLTQILPILDFCRNKTYNHDK